MANVVIEQNEKGWLLKMCDELVKFYKWLSGEKLVNSMEFALKSDKEQEALIEEYCLLIISD